MSNDSMDLPAPPEWPDWKSDPLVIHPVRMKGAETFSIPSPAIEGAREPANNSRIKPEALQTLQAALDRQLEEVERDFNAGKIDAATYLARTRRLREAKVAFFVTALAAPFTDLLARLQVAFNTSDIAPGTVTCCATWIRSRLRFDVVYPDGARMPVVMSLERPDWDKDLKSKTRFFSIASFQVDHRLAVGALPLDVHALAVGGPRDCGNERIPGAVRAHPS